jgi:hypothetical protein
MDRSMRSRPAIRTALADDVRRQLDVCSGAQLVAAQRKRRALLRRDRSVRMRNILRARLTLCTR